MMKTLKTIHWVASSHWDREWHRPFEGFRVRLVDMVDRAVACVENAPGFPCFFLDGQSIILKDYLEIRPEMAPRLRRLLRQEKLFAGPFYVLQDEMVEDGELLVRNLQKGLALARAHGTRRFVGYTPDTFGHCAQLPQLLRLGGVRSVIFSRAFTGTQQENVWESPDGSKVFFVWLPLGYGGFSHRDCLNDGRHLPEDPKEALETFEKNFARLRPYVRCGAALVMDGGDHLFADPAAVRLASDFNAKHPGGPRFRISSLIEAVADIERRASPRKVCGEIRKPANGVAGWILPGTYSSRMPLKYGLSTSVRELLALEKLWTLRPHSRAVSASTAR